MRGLLRARVRVGPPPCLEQDHPLPWVVGHRPSRPGHHVDGGLSRPWAADRLRAEPPGPR